MPDDINDLRELRRLEEYLQNGRDWRYYARDKLAENESFIGAEPDPIKLTRLNSMRADARAISESEPQITFRDELPDNTTRNGHVRLDFPSMLYLTDRAAVERLADLFACADFIALGETESGIRITFGVRDLWYEAYDEEE